MLFNHGLQIRDLAKSCFQLFQQAAGMAFFTRKKHQHIAQFNKVANNLSLLYIGAPAVSFSALCTLVFFYG